VAALQVWLDEFDETASHWALVGEDGMAAAARLSVHASIGDVPEAEVYASFPREWFPAPVASFNRLVVHPCARGRGFSGQFDRARLAAARQAGCACVVGGTHSNARIAQLSSVGFAVLGHGRPHSRWLFLRGLVPTLLAYRAP
jgi:GNAT superfamily N-acetyltransferase